VADLPTPDDLIRKLKDTHPPAPPAPTMPAPGAPSGPIQQMQSTPTQGATALAVDTDALARFVRFEDVVELIRAHRDVKLLVEIETCVRLVSYTPGRIEFEPTDNAPRDLAARIGSRLQAFTGNRWAVVIGSGGESTIAEVRDAADLALKAEATDHPMVQAVFDAFPGAKILQIRTLADIAAEAETEALPEVDDEWDPFDED